jgi:hypothetical protein
MSWKLSSTLDKTNNISVNNLSANHFTLRDAYNGQFVIDGTLQVKKNTTLADVHIQGNCQIDNNTTINGNVVMKQNVKIMENMRVQKDIAVSGNVLIEGNLHIMQNYEIEKNLRINGNALQMNKITDPYADPNADSVYFVTILSNGANIGLNKLEATYSLDVESYHEKGIRIHSDLSSCNSILAENTNQLAVSLYVDDDEKSILFYDPTVAANNHKIQSFSNGNLVSTAQEIFLNSDCVKIGNIITNRSNDYDNLTIFDNTVNNSIPGLEYSEFGTALNLIAGANNVITGTNIQDEFGLGCVLLGGRQGKENKKSKALIGLYDDRTQNVFTTQTILAGKGNSKNRFTMGINTHSPETDVHVLSINGPVKISHNEITNVYENTFSLHKMIFCKKSTYRMYGIAFGTIDSKMGAGGDRTLTDNHFIYTTDGGNTWSPSLFDLQINVDITIECGFVCNDKVAVVGGQYGLLLFSSDGFKTWHKFDGMLLTETITAVTIIEINFSFIFCFVYGTNMIGYFTIPSFDILAAKKLATTVTGTKEFILDVAVNTFIDGRSLFYGNKPNVKVFGSQKINNIIYNGTTITLRVILPDQIIDLNVTSDISNIFTYKETIITSAILNNNYYSISYSPDSTVSYCTSSSSILRIPLLLDNNNKITVTTLTPSVPLNDLFILENNKAIAVGNSGRIVITNDGTNWTTPDEKMINSSGLFNLILSKSFQLLQVSMPDDDTFIFLSQISPEKSIIYRCHFPEIFNRKKNQVLDVTGNMLLSGDIEIKETAIIQGNTTIASNLTVNNNTTSKHIYTTKIDGIAPDHVLYIGSENKNTQISGDILTINANDYEINSNIINISKNVTVHGNLFVDTINSLTDTLLVGGTETGGKTIKISHNTMSGVPNNVFIGGSDDNVTISGKNLHIEGTLSTIENQIQLRSKTTDNYASGGSGIFIRDNSNDSSGYIKLNSKLDGFELKSSVDKSNILNIQVNELIIEKKKDLFTNLPIENGLVILKNTAAVYNDNTIGSNVCTMTTAWFDVNNILLGNYKANGNSLLLSSSRQTISTDIHFLGNVFLENNTDSTNTSGTGTGTLQVTGGISVQGNVTIGKHLYSQQSYLSNTNLKGNTIIDGNTCTINTQNILITGNNSSNSGNVIISSNILSTFSGNTIMTNTNITKGTVQTLNVTGNFISTGNVFTVQGPVIINTSATAKGNLNCDGNFIVTNKNDTSRLGDDSAAALIQGGIVIKKKNYTYGSTSLCMQNIIQIVPLTDNNNNILFNSDNIKSTSITGRDKTYNVITGNSYQKGIYTISVGSESNISNFENTFNNNTDTTYWTGSIGTASGTLIDKIITKGEYIQITLPYSCILTHYYITNNTIYGTPCSWILCGSNNNVDFTIIDSVTDYYSTLNDNTQNPYFISSAYFQQFTTFRYIITKVFFLTGITEFSLKKIELHGYCSINTNNSSLLCAGPATIIGDTMLYGITKIKNPTIATNSSSGSFIVNGDMGVTGNAFINNAIIEKDIVIRGNSTLTGTLNLNGPLNVLGQFTFGTIIAHDTTDSTAIGTGALISNGGASIAGNLFIGNNCTIQGKTFCTKDITVSGGNIIANGLTIHGNAIIDNTLRGNISSKNIIVEADGIFDCRGTYALASLSLSSNIESTDINTGSLHVLGGGSITGNVNIGTNANVLGALFSPTITCDLITPKNCTITETLIAKGNIFADTLTVKGNTSITNDFTVKGNTVLQMANIQATTVTTLLVTSSLDTTSTITGGSISKGGSAISGNCFVGGKMVIFGQQLTPSTTIGGGKYNNDCTVTFPQTSSPPPSTTFTSPTPTCTNPNTNYLYSTYNSKYPTQETYFRVDNQVSVDSYKNGIYATLTASPAFIDKKNNFSYYGCFSLLSNTVIPWISSFLYDNGTGLPYLSQASLHTSTIDMSAPVTVVGNTRYEGEWINYYFPYNTTVTSYTIQFSKTNITGLESYPTSWTLFGYLNSTSSLVVIDQHDNNAISNAVIKTTIATSANIYKWFRIAITKVNINATPGYCVTGITSFSIDGVPVVTVDSGGGGGGSGSGSGGGSGSGSGGGGGSGSGDLNLIGANTFVGNSTIIAFGDIATYGNVKIFQDMRINGNIIPSGTLNIQGNIKTTSVQAVSFNTTSDYRIKSNIMSLDNSYVIDNLRPVSYFNQLTNKNDIGLIAHELQEYYPFLVNQNKDDDEHLQSINYASIISLLIHEIQSLKRQYSHNLLKQTL